MLRRNRKRLFAFRKLIKEKFETSSSFEIGSIPHVRWSGPEMRPWPDGLRLVYCNSIGGADQLPAGPEEAKDFQQRALGKC